MILSNLEIMVVYMISERIFTLQRDRDKFRYYMNLVLCHHEHDENVRYRDR